MFLRVKGGRKNTSRGAARQMWEGKFIFSTYSIATVKLPLNKALNLQLLWQSRSEHLCGWIRGGSLLELGSIHILLPLSLTCTVLHQLCATFSHLGVHTPHSCTNTRIFELLSHPPSSFCQLPSAGLASLWPSSATTTVSFGGPQRLRKRRCD